MLWNAVRGHNVLFGLFGLIFGAVSLLSVSVLPAILRLRTFVQINSDVVPFGVRTFGWQKGKRCRLADIGQVVVADSEPSNLFRLIKAGFAGVSTRSVGSGCLIRLKSVSSLIPVTIGSPPRTAKKGSGLILGQLKRHRIV